MNAYGGLGKVGLDYQHSNKQAEALGAEYQVASFSSGLQHLVPQAKIEEEEEEELLSNLASDDDNLLSENSEEL